MEVWNLTETATHPNFGSQLCYSCFIDKDPTSEAGRNKDRVPGEPSTAKRGLLMYTLSPLGTLIHQTQCWFGLYRSRDTSISPDDNVKTPPHLFASEIIKNGSYGSSKINSLFHIVFANLARFKNTKTYSWCILAL